MKVVLEQFQFLGATTALPTAAASTEAPAPATPPASVGTTKGGVDFAALTAKHKAAQAPKPAVSTENLDEDVPF